MYFDKIIKISCCRYFGSSKNQNWWIKRQARDAVVKLAKSKGYRSRGSIKLEDILLENKIIHKNSIVLDLGSSPGGWSDVLSRLIYPNKEAVEPYRIISVDILPMKPIIGCKFYQGDIQDPLIKAEIHKYLKNRKFSVVLCDVAPNFSGNHSTDHIRQIELSKIGLEFSLDYLKSDGFFLTKVIQGNTLKEYELLLKKSFKNVKYIKPYSSRKESTEIYILSSILR